MQNSTASALENYHYIFTCIKLVAPMFNSLLMCAAVIAALIVVASMAAYSLTRRRMRTGNFWRIFFLAGLTVPFQILMLPLSRQFNYLGIGYTSWSCRCPLLYSILPCSAALSKD